MLIQRHVVPAPPVPPPPPEVTYTITLTQAEALAYLEIFGQVNSRALAAQSKVNEQFYSLGIDIYHNLSNKVGKR